MLQIKCLSDCLSLNSVLICRLANRIIKHDRSSHSSGKTYLNYSKWTYTKLTIYVPNTLSLANKYKYIYIYIVRMFCESVIIYDMNNHIWQREYYRTGKKLEGQETKKEDAITVNMDRLQSSRNLKVTWRCMMTMF